MSALSTLRGRKRLLRVGAWFLLAFAIAPNVFYLGHWQSPEQAQAARVHTQQGANVEPETGGHVEHCHTGPAKCGGGESMVGSLWVGEDAGLLVLDASVHEAPVATGFFSIEPAATPILQPPRTAI